MQEEENKGCAYALELLAVALILGLASTFMRAFILREFWAWFIAPTWGLATPSLITAHALVFVIGVLTNRKRSWPEDEKTLKSIFRVVTKQVLGYAVVWSVGALLHAWQQVL